MARRRRLPQLMHERHRTMTDTNDTPTATNSEPFNVHEFLAKHRMIGVVWCIEDVQSVRPNLTDDQAWEGLQAVERRHDPEIGINWVTLEIFADDLFPEPDSKQEA